MCIYTKNKCHPQSWFFSMFEFRLIHSRISQSFGFHVVFTIWPEFSNHPFYTVVFKHFSSWTLLKIVWKLLTLSSEEWTYIPFCITFHGAYHFWTTMDPNEQSKMTPLGYGRLSTCWGLLNRPDDSTDTSTFSDSSIFFIALSYLHKHIYGYLHNLCI